MSSCRTKDQQTETTDDSVTHVVELHKNSLNQNLSSFLKSQSSSPVNWQPWDTNLFSRAASERKTIFALIGSGTDPNTLAALDRINNSPTSCALLNSHHVNVLIDSNLHPDLEFFTALLCTQSRADVSPPLLIWLSYEGNPISWSPVSTRYNTEIDELLSRMSNTVYRLWRDDPEYVLKNSREDFARRSSKNMPSPYEGDAAGLIQRSIRQAASLYDPTSNTIDGIRKLQPARYLNLLIQASRHPDSSETQNKRYIDIASSIADNVLLHGLIDPLDGGIFNGIQRSTSALPDFAKSLQTQAHGIGALFELYRETGEIRFLNAANRILNYTEQNLSNTDGGYIEGIVYKSPTPQESSCIWTYEEIESALAPDEFTLASQAFGLKGLGNIPLFDDPNKNFFRKNTLTWKSSMDELANITSTTPEALKPKLESITKKLAKLRKEKTHKPFVENLTVSGNNAMLASALVSGYRATGEIAYLKKAQKTLDYIRKHFVSTNGTLHRAKYGSNLNKRPSNAGNSALVVQAALDYHEVTLDETWLQFAKDIHNNMNKSLAPAPKYYVNEYSGADYPQKYETSIFYTITALNNHSTWSLAFSNATRLSRSSADSSLKAQAENLQAILRVNVGAAPMACTDFLTAEAIINSHRVYIKTPANPEFLLAASKLPCQIIAVTENNTYPELGDSAASLTAGHGTVVHRGKVIGTAATAKELKALVK